MTLIEMWLASIAAFGIMEGLGRFHEPNPNKRAWVQRLEDSWLRWPFKGLMASIVGPLSLWWIRNRLQPTLAEDPVSILMFAIAGFISMGIGWTIGGWLTTTDYKVIGGNNA